MKKVFWFVGYICIITGLLVASYGFCEIFFGGDSNYNINNEYISDSSRSSDYSETVTEDMETGRYVEPSSVSGYLMLAEGDDVNIYEVYSNGYKEKIAGLDANPLHMRKADYKILTEGIFVDSYEEMCGLMEDYSS